MSTRTHRRKKRGIALWISYAIRWGIPLLCAIVILCVGLAIRGALADDADEEQHAAGREEQTDPGPQTGYTPPVSEPPIQSKNFTVMLDAGHGGTDPGCVQNDILEKDLALAITLRVKEKLENEGFAVLLTRDTDETLSLSDRVALTNQSSADCFVSIHCNMYADDTSIRGLECYFYRSEEGEALAEYIIEAVNGASITNNGVMEGNYMVVRDADIPAVLVETGYLSNPEECEALTAEKYQDVIADVITEGIEKMWTSREDSEMSDQGGN